MANFDFAKIESVLIENHHLHRLHWKISLSVNDVSSTIEHKLQSKVSFQQVMFTTMQNRISLR